MDRLTYCFDYGVLIEGLRSIFIATRFYRNIVHFADDIATLLYFEINLYFGILNNNYSINPDRTKG